MRFPGMHTPYSLPLSLRLMESVHVAPAASITFQEAEQAGGELYAADVALQRKRYVVERTLGWLKGFRRLRYRMDRTAASIHAFVYLAVLVLCVRRLISPSRANASAR